MAKFNKFTYRPESLFEPIFERVLTRNVLIEKIPCYIKNALCSDWKKKFNVNFRYDLQCNFCRNKGMLLVPYFSENSNKVLDICNECDNMMQSWKLKNGRVN